MRQFFYKLVLMAFPAFCVLFVYRNTVYATQNEGQEEYITISVDASDDNEGLKYALDSDAPEAFGDSNTFTIPAGTSHTIYVKDLAGNVTSQKYTPPETPAETVVSPVPTTAHASEAEEERQINIELELGDSPKQDYSNYEYLTDSKIEDSNAVVQNKTTTNGSDTAETVFYTITTAEGDVFYLVIEQGSSNNVHLLNTVTLDDLAALAEGGKNNSSSASAEEDNLLEALKMADSNQADNKVGNLEENNDTSPNPSGVPKLLILLICAIAGGIYYYLKVYKNKKDETMDAMDAMDMDEFAFEYDDDDEEELNFDDKEKQELLNKIIAEDEEEYTTGEPEFLSKNPEDYVEETADEGQYTMPEPSIQSEYSFNEIEEYDEELDSEEEE